MQGKSKWLLALTLIIIVSSVSFFTVWHFQSQTQSAVEVKTLFQVAEYNTFSLGNYTGFMNFSDLEKHGDFGVGTFDGLNGEMVALNGIFYQISVNGKPVVVPLNATTPYATITFFKSDITFTLTNFNYSQLKSRIIQSFPSQNAIYAVKVSGFYYWVQTRSEYKQLQPYPPLAQALSNQVIFTLNNVSATAVGFWFPSSMNGTDPVGYHFHFITNNHDAGGHLLDCTLKNATVEIEEIKNYNLVLS